MKIGYARVSTKDQDLSLQIDALEDVGCTRIYKEQISGTTKNRPELQMIDVKLFQDGTLATNPLALIPIPQQKVWSVQDSNL